MSAITTAAISQIRRRHPGVRTHQFRAALRDAVVHYLTDTAQYRSEHFHETMPSPVELLDEARSEDWYHISRPPFQPDLCEIDTGKGEITIYEIEDTHPLTEHKLRDVLSWWFAIDDDMGWSARLIVTDRYGLTERELPLSNLYFEVMLGAPSDSPAALHTAQQMGIRLHDTAQTT